MRGAAGAAGIPKRALTCGIREGGARARQARAGACLVGARAAAAGARLGADAQAAALEALRKVAPVAGAVHGAAAVVRAGRNHVRRRRRARPRARRPPLLLAQHLRQPRSMACSRPP